MKIGLVHVMVVIKLMVLQEVFIVKDVLKDTVQLVEVPLVRFVKLILFLLNQKILAHHVQQIVFRLQEHIDVIVYMVM
jgi:hypothetical protein